jgi:hypothetical protein
VTRLISLALATLALLLAATTAAAEPNDGTLDGQVTNGTAGASIPTDDQVTLLVFGKADQAQKNQLTAPIDADGHYAFSGLDRSADNVYVVLVDHGGVAYPGSAPVDLEQDATGHADIQVFDSTASDADIHFERLNLVVAGTDPGLMQLYEMGAIVNASDRTFVPEDPQAGALSHGLRLGLPHGALGAKVQAGFSDGSLTPAPGGVQVNEPIMPGRHEFALSFRMPYTGTTADVGFQVPYPATTFNIYVPEGGPRIESDRLTTHGRASMGARSFSVSTSDNVNGNDSVAARLADLPQAGGELSTLQIGLAGLGALLVIGGLGAVGVSLRARRRAPRIVSPAERERQRLINRLATLDERYESGQIAAADYQNAREQSKQRLVELTRSLS